MLTGVQCNSLDLGLHVKGEYKYMHRDLCMYGFTERDVHRCKTKFKVENNYKAHGLSGCIRPLQLDIKRL